MTNQGLLPIVTSEAKSSLNQEIQKDSKILVKIWEEINQFNPYVSRILSSFVDDSNNPQLYPLITGICLYRLLEKGSELPRVSKETYERFIEEFNSTNKDYYSLYLLENLEKNNLDAGSFICSAFLESQNKDTLYSALSVYKLLEMESIFRLEKQMERAVKEENYEGAAKIRDKLKAAE